MELPQWLKDFIRNFKLADIASNIQITGYNKETKDVNVNIQNVHNIQNVNIDLHISAPNEPPPVEQTATIITPVIESRIKEELEKRLELYIPTTADRPGGVSEDEIKTIGEITYATSVVSSSASIGPGGQGETIVHDPSDIEKQILLQLKCKNCGRMFSSGIKLSTRASIILRRNFHHCPHCNHTDQYDQPDYVSFPILP